MTKTIVSIDSQRLEAIQFCPCFFHYKFDLNLVPINTPDYLERGGLIHAMLAEYYILKKYRENWSKNNKNHQDVVQACINVGRYKGMRMQLDIAEVEETIEVFRQYTDLWENDSWYDIHSVEAVGAKILFEDKDLTILYEVKIDLVLRLQDRLVPVDHKHSKARRDPNQLSNQFKGYCWFMGSNNLIVNEIGFQKTVKPPDKFRRHVLSFPQAIIEEWIENTVYWVKFGLRMEDEKCYPRNFSSCDKFAGCDFKHICSAEPGDLREFRLRRDFHEREWSPGKEHL
jgi:hypothetical protein